MVNLSTCASPSVVCLGSRCNGLSTSSVQPALCLPCTLGQPCAEASLSGSTLRPDPVQWAARSDPQPAPADDCKPRLKSLSCSAFVTCSGLRSSSSGSYRSSRGSVQIFIPQGKQSTSASSWRSADEEPPRDSSSSQLL